MTLRLTAELVDRARHERTAVLAFNVVTLEHAEAVAAAAAATGRPAIIQVSQNAVRYHRALEPLAAAVAALARATDADLALHLDHVDDLELLHRAAAAGFGSVMFDASALPYGDNVRATRDAADWAHAEGLWLEAELGYVGGKPDSPVHAHSPGTRTDPGEAAAFVAETGADALAVAVGSSHAMTERTATIDIELIARLRSAVPVPLVLHGSSGVPHEQLAQAMAAGISKVNVGTALNVAFTDALRRALPTSQSVDPRLYLDLGRQAMTATVEHLLTLRAGPPISASAASSDERGGTARESG